MKTYTIKKTYPFDEFSKQVEIISDYFLYSEKPKCKYCKKEMEEWNPWAEEFFHTKCFIEANHETIVKAFREIIAGLKS